MKTKPSSLPVISASDNTLRYCYFFACMIESNLIDYSIRIYPS